MYGHCKTTNDYHICSRRKNSVRYTTVPKQCGGGCAPLDLGASRRPLRGEGRLRCPPQTPSPVSKIHKTSQANRTVYKHPSVDIGRHGNRHSIRPRSHRPNLHGCYPPGSLLDTVFSGPELFSGICRAFANIVQSVCQCRTRLHGLDYTIQPGCIVCGQTIRSNPVV